MILIIVRFVKLAEFLDLLNCVHPLKVIEGDARLGWHEPPPVVEAESLFKVDHEIVWPPENLLHVIDVALIQLNRLKLFLQELEAEECEKYALYES